MDVNDSIIFRAKMRNLGIRAMVSAALVVVAGVVVLGVFAWFLSQFVDIKSLPAGWVSISGIVLSLVAMAPGFYAGIRPYYLTYDGTTLSAQTAFGTVSKQVRSSEHRFGIWKTTRNAVTYVQGPVLLVECNFGELSIGCLDPAGKWFKRLTMKKPKNVRPSFVVGPEDFGRLLVALKIIESE